MRDEAALCIGRVIGLRRPHRCRHAKRGNHSGAQETGFKGHFLVSFVMFTALTDVSQQKESTKPTMAET